MTIAVWETVRSIQGRWSSTGISPVQVQLADRRNMTRRTTQSVEANSVVTVNLQSSQNLSTSFCSLVEGGVENVFNLFHLLHVCMDVK